MSRMDDVAYHAERERTERRLASQAACVAAARAHRQLAELHADRVRAL